MFANLSNHPETQWSEEQRRAAEAIARPILDFPFPGVDPAASAEAVGELARMMAATVMMAGPAAALVEGEFTLTYAVVGLLMRAGVPCYAATSNREAIERPLDGGGIGRSSVYRFVSLRRYLEIE